MTAALQADGNRVSRKLKRKQHFLSDSMIVLVDTSMSVNTTELAQSAILVIKIGTRWCFKGRYGAGHGRRAECPLRSCTPERARSREKSKLRCPCFCT